jgi:hypothetical protein
MGERVLDERLAAKVRQRRTDRRVGDAEVDNPFAPGLASGGEQGG